MSPLRGKIKGILAGYTVAMVTQEIDHNLFTSIFGIIVVVSVLSTDREW